MYRDLLYWRSREFVTRFSNAMDFPGLPNVLVAGEAEGSSVAVGGRT